MFFPPAVPVLSYYNPDIIGGSRTRWRPGVEVPLDSYTFHSNDAITRSTHSSDGEAEIAVHPGVPISGQSGDQSLARFNDKFDDAPYVPPRVPQAELHTYPALDPRVRTVYDPPNHDIPYPYEGGTSPAESHASEGNWSTSSSSSTSSHQLAHDYLVEQSSQYSQAPPPTRQYTEYYPAYQGQHRLGLEHVRYGPHPSNTGGNYYRHPPHGYQIGDILSSDIFDDTHTTSPQMNYPTASSQGSSTSSAVPTTSQTSNVSTFVLSSAPVVNVSRSRFPDAGPYLRQQLGLSPHEPISLQTLPDPAPGEKPSTPLPMLIKLAIYGSPNKQLTLQEIYNELEKRFEWFRQHKHEKPWKNSIRHNLSLNKVFKHVPRPITEPGKGSYWQLDVSGGEGYKRLRKRRPKNRIVASEEEDDEGSEMDEDRPDAASPSRSSATPVEEVRIDPELRSEGHVVGEGRTRSVTRRTGGGTPYPSQSPRYPQAPLPAVAGNDTNAPGQSSVRFGQSSFPTYPQARPPLTSSSASFAAVSPSSMGLTPTTSTMARPLQYVASYDRAAQIPHPLPRSGIEYTMDPEGLPTARRVMGYQEPPSPSQEDSARSSPESSSGSSRTWKDAQSESETQR